MDEGQCLNQQDVQKIGHAFVMQYYMQMHKDPAQMHRFYLDQSVFTRGGPEMGTEKPVVGKSAIHEKILCLGLHQVHTKIRQVDSHFTISNGLGPAVIVQVTGELSNAGHPMRPFVQSFVLAQESSRIYYVHNDIFRYQIYDEDLISETDTTEVAVECEVTTTGTTERPLCTELPLPPQPSLEESSGYRNQEDNVSEHSAKGSPAPVMLPCETPPTSNVVDHYEGSPELIQANGILEEEQDHSSGFPVEEVEEMAITSDEVESQKTTDISWASKLKSNSASRAQTSVSGNTYTAQPTSKPMAFASSQSRAPSANITSSGQVNPSQPLPQREGKTGNRRQQQETRPLPPPEKKPVTTPSSLPLSRTAPDSHQIFVGNLPNGTREDELREVFKTYGNVIEVRINPKNFGFVVFDNEECVQALIDGRSTEQILLHERKLNIEEKRPSFQKSMAGGSNSSGSMGFSRKPFVGSSSGNMFGGGGNRFSRGGGMSAGNKPPPRR